jgi:hypothetical protein
MDFPYSSRPDPTESFPTAEKAASLSVFSLRLPLSLCLSLDLSPCPSLISCTEQLDLALLHTSIVDSDLLMESRCLQCFSRGNFCGLGFDPMNGCVVSTRPFEDVGQINEEVHIASVEGCLRRPRVQLKKKSCPTRVGLDLDYILALGRTLIASAN